MNQQSISQDQVDQHVTYCSNIAVNAVLVSHERKIIENNNYKIEIIRLQRENTEFSNQIAKLQKENESLRPPVKEPVI